MFDGRWRDGVEHGVQPLAAAVRRIGIRPDHLTILGLVLSAGCAVAIGGGRLGLGLALLILGALPDLLDGAVARATNTSSVRGAFLDSVVDRVTDAAVLGGVAWYLASTDGAHAALLPFAVLGVSTLISYERAKAEALGFEAKGGLMERAERVILLCFGVAFSAVLVPVLWVMLVLTSATAVQRFAKVWRQASAPRPPRLSRRIGADGRWRAWREAASLREIHSPRRTHRWRERQREARSRWRRRAGTRP